MTSKEMEQMRKGLLSACAAKQKLDALDDSISKIIKSNEEALESLGLGFKISAEMDCYDGGTLLLEFRKWSGKWRLVYLDQEYPTEFPEAKPLSDWDRDTRRQVLTHLMPRLILNVNESLQERIVESERAINTGEEVLKVINDVLVPF